MNDREAFEAWAAQNVGQPDFGGYHTDGGRWFYRHNFIRMCWGAWQAAIAHARQQSGDYVMVPREPLEKARAALEAIDEAEGSNSELGARREAERTCFYSIQQLIADNLSEPYDETPAQQELPQQSSEPTGDRVEIKRFWDELNAAAPAQQEPQCDPTATQCPKHKNPHGGMCDLAQQEPPQQNTEHVDPVVYRITISHWHDGQLDVSFEGVGEEPDDLKAIAFALRKLADDFDRGNRGRKDQ